MLSMHIPYFLHFSILLLITACTPVSDNRVAQWPTTTTVRMVQTTPVPTIERQLNPIPSDQPEPTATTSLMQCQGTAGQPMTRHTVVADLYYENRALTVQQRTDYINRTNTSLSDLVMNVKPNAWPELFTLNSLKLADHDLTYELTGQRLTIELPQPLDPGCAVTLDLTFKLRIPPIDLGGTNAYQGYLGYSPRQLNLGHWLPVVAARLDSEWITREVSPIGEQEMLDEANWDATLNLHQGPAGLRVVAPGIVEENSPTRWHFNLENARDFSLSMSEHYRAASQRSDSGVKVELYSFDDALVPSENGIVDSAAYALEMAARSVDMYEDLYGRYPYNRLVVVQADFPDGMEFSGIVFVGGEYFRSFTGNPASYLMMITVHEVSHQWWYARVGNDQALAPWLDESLATYSEYAFIEEYYPELKNWWWDFRINRWSPTGFVDSSVYEFDSRRAYINAVYLRGVIMLRDLRDLLGTEPFYDWLRRYADIGANRIMTPDQFWALLTPEQIAATADIRATYLRHPELVRSY